MKGSFKLFHYINDFLMISCRISNGSDGWLWSHEVEGNEFFNVFAIHTVDNRRYRGIGINFVVVNISVAWKKVQHETKEIA